MGCVVPLARCHDIFDPVLYSSCMLFERECHLRGYSAPPAGTAAICRRGIGFKFDLKHCSIFGPGTLRDHIWPLLPFHHCSSTPMLVKANRHKRHKPELLQNSCGQGNYAAANTMLPRHVPTGDTGAPEQHKLQQCELNV